MAVASTSLPNPPTERVITFENLSGGLNLFELPYRMDQSQSPEMENLWWRDGLLSCRDGQAYVSSAQLGTGLACAERLFWGYAVFHIGDGLYAAKPGAEMALTKLCGGLPEVRGSFIRYRDALLYKTKGAYKSITYDEETAALTARDVEAYVPVTAINCDPSTGAGDLYQPENRLSGKKTLWYTAAQETRGVLFTATGVATIFPFETEDGEPIAAISQVFVGTTLIPETDYTVELDGASATVTFTTAPEAEESVSVLYGVGVRVYHLPVKDLDAVTEITVDGEAVSGYTADLEAGTVTFDTAPPVQVPPVNNTVVITYQKDDDNGYQSIMDCRYGCAYGGTGGAVLVLAGSTKQPNAYFWNGNHVAMDPGYFPYESYNLAGDSLEPVTGFGLQAGYLVVFKTHAVGRCLLGTETIGDRAYLTLDYTPVNAAIGCDLPFTIRLVENNLVWCSTYGGVYRLEDTTAALENQVRCISGNINGCAGRPGLLEALEAGEAVALDDAERYWVAAGGVAYVWDYHLSTAGKPSWFYFTNIPAVAFFRSDSRQNEDGTPFTGPLRVYHLDDQGRVSRFVRNFYDYGGAISKVFRFPAQDFGGHISKKNIRRVILSTRSDTDTVIELTYSCDFGTRRELLPVESFSWRLFPRDLRRRMLAVRRFAHVAVRKPGLRHVNHFTMRLSNQEPGCDMSLVSAQIVYTFQEDNR